MANEMITAFPAQFANPVAFLSSGDFSSAFPAANIWDYTHPSRVWRASSLTSGTTAVIFDFGAATAVAATLLYNANVTAVKVQGHASNSWGSPSFSLDVTIAQDPLDSLYKAFVALTSFNYRFMRIVANTSSATDGTSYMQLGAAVPMATYTQWAQNPGFPYQRSPLRGLISNPFDGGGLEPVIIGRPYAQVGVGSDNMALSMKATVEAFLRDGTSQPFVWYRNWDDTSEVYIARITGAGAWQLAEASAFQMGSVLMTSAP